MLSSEGPDTARAKGSPGLRPCGKKVVFPCSLFVQLSLPDAWQEGPASHQGPVTVQGSWSQQLCFPLFDSRLLDFTYWSN